MLHSTVMALVMKWYTVCSTVTSHQSWSGTSIRPLWCHCLLQVHEAQQVFFGFKHFVHAALRASNALSQHVETLPNATVPSIVRHLQSPDGEPLSLCTLCYTCKSWALFVYTAYSHSVDFVCSCVHTEMTHVLFVCQGKAITQYVLGPLPVYWHASVGLEI